MAISAPTQPKRNRPAVQPQRGDGQNGSINVGENERLLSLLGGGTLALAGLSRGSLGGLGLALLGGALAYRGATGHCSAYSSFGISTAEPRGERTSIPAGHGVKMETSVTIFRPVEELYRFWRNFENLPRFMRHLESVRTTNGNRSHWVARGPLDVRFEWDAEVITDATNELIGWRSLPGSTVDTAGSVHFSNAPGDRGTEGRVVLKYKPPAGKLGDAIARLFGAAPDQLIREDLRRFKSLMETGTIPTTQGQPSGPRPRQTWKPVAEGLGWFSVGLGLAEVLMPDTVADLIGNRDIEVILPLLGARELVSGVGVLSGYKQTGWLWSRVAGDLMDLAVLGAAFLSDRSDKAKVVAAGAAVLGVTALDVMASEKYTVSPLGEPSEPKERVPQVAQRRQGRR